MTTRVTYRGYIFEIKTADVSVTGGKQIEIVSVMEISGRLVATVPSEAKARQFIDGIHQLALESTL